MMPSLTSSITSSSVIEYQKLSIAVVVSSITAVFFSRNLIRIKSNSYFAPILKIFLALLHRHPDNLIEQT